MKSAFYNSRYFVGIGLLMLLCFSGIAWYISKQLSAQTKMLSTDAASGIFRLKAAIIRNEFQSFSESMRHADMAVHTYGSAKEVLAHKKQIETQLLSDVRFNKGWYAVKGPSGSVFTMVQKDHNQFNHSAPDIELKAVISTIMSENAGTGVQTKIINLAGSKHWLLFSKRSMPDASTVSLGIDIDLKDLQRYLQHVDSLSRASVFVIDEHNKYITGPEEQLIDRQISGLKKKGLFKLSDSLSTYEFTVSDYLKIPVVRYYTPLNIGNGVNWTMVIDTPLLAVDEGTKAIDSYVKLFFIFTTILIICLVAWAQVKWRREFTEKKELSLLAERQQRDNAFLQLNVLKDKINPHFLFNTLSSLNALIEQDRELAKAFVLKLSKVYRYVLESHPSGLSSLQDEIDFVKEYFFLLKIRFGNALEPLQLQLDPNIENGRIIFMSLQLLIENAVKHNIVSKEKPLKINIEGKGRYIIVRNNLQLRAEAANSSGQGLQYLEKTYSFFNEQNLRYGIENNEYVCYLPVLP
ncbi:histidine kinase [Mucilaginibacter sp. Bleaf8]|uniref:histidine kinase n=1 Tax=Mucilaginibacter sp. Bleaf8 TaxID=2834430 RepID=UPI001BCCEA06|nr:sensor histidine kinase [Mucilaginibacter sp. Bleaf8]MBS7564802.1 histidine kinase [Mucilaginibacter sp. Bleaf8]